MNSSNDYWAIEIPADNYIAKLRRQIELEILQLATHKTKLKNKKGGPLVDINSINEAFKEWKNTELHLSVNDCFRLVIALDDYISMENWDGDEETKDYYCELAEKIYN